MPRRLRPAVVREGQSIVFLREGQYLLATGPVRATEWRIDYDHDEIRVAGHYAPVELVPRSGTINLQLQAVLPDKQTMKIAAKVARAERRRLARELKKDQKRKRKVKK